MALRTLFPADDDFTFWLTLAHRWTQDRPRLFPHTGGYALLFVYLDEARRPDRKQIGVFRDGEMVSLIAVEYHGDGAYCFHVTSPKRADTSAIRAATRAVVTQLFESLNAQYLWTTVPEFNGHRHRGSEALAECCGATPEGEPETEHIGQTVYTWRRYSLKRENWNGAEINTNQ